MPLYWSDSANARLGKLPGMDGGGAVDDLRFANWSSRSCGSESWTGEEL